MSEITMTASLENLLEPAVQAAPLTGRDTIAEMRLKSRAEYRHVVFALAQDEDPGEVDMNSLLFSVGKSFDQLESDVELVRQRKAWSLQRDQADQWKAEADQATEELAKVRSKAEKLSQEYKEKIEPLIARQRELSEKAGRLMDQRCLILGETQRNLERTADPAIDEEIEEAQKRHSYALKMVNVYRTDGHCSTPWTAQNESSLRELEERIRQQKARMGFADQDDIDRAHLLKRKKAAYPQLQELEKQEPELQQKVYDAVNKKLDWRNVGL
jgi:hypothetical protein